MAPKFLKGLKRQSLQLLFFATICLLAFTSCDRSILYSKNQHIQKETWKAGDTLFFNFEVKDILSAYDFYIDTRNTTDYNYQNLYLFITAYYPGDTYSRDTAECLLAAPDGKWLGKGLGKHLDSRFLFRKGVRFRKAGNYTIGINQAMREEKLKGISDIGIMLRKQSE